MIPFEQVEEVTGHAPGGVCPFGIKDGIAIPEKHLLLVERLLD